MKTVFWFCVMFGAGAFAEEFDTPKEAVLKEPVTLTVNLGQAKAAVKFPAGTVAEVLAVEGDSVVLKKNNAQGAVPMAATDYGDRLRGVEERREAAEAEKKRAREVADDLRRANEEMEKKRIENLEIQAGEKPFVSVDAFTGAPVIPMAMTRNIKMRLKDPDSFQPREVTMPKVAERNGVACWKILLVYGARNGFGGYTKNLATAYMKGSTLLDLTLEDY